MYFIILQTERKVYHNYWTVVANLFLCVSFYVECAVVQKSKRTSGYNKVGFQPKLSYRLIFFVSGPDEDHPFYYHDRMTMKRNLYIIMALIATTFVARAQSQEFTFGKIDKADLEMIAYPLDSGAEAVYLVNTGDVTFNQNDFYMYMTRHVRIKVLKEAGFDRADIEVRYLRGAAPAKVKAATYNLENGKMVTTSVSKKDWVDEKVNDKLWSKKLSFPDVKVGSIIEYTFRQKVSYFSDLPSWNFQMSIPVVYTEYRIEIPEYGEYQPGLQGYIQPIVYNPNGGFYHLIFKDVPALKKEPFVATMENFRSKIEFEIKSFSAPGYGTKVFMESWDAINRTLSEDEDFGGALDNTNQLRRIYPEGKNWGNNVESLIDIYQYVRDHFKWNERYGIYLLDSPRSVWEDGEGNGAEINLILGMFLRKAGILSDPVILSTRGNGYLNRGLPLTDQFNYVLVCANIGGKEYLLDATDKFRPYNVLPNRALNGDGFLVSPVGARWMNLGMNKEMDSKTITGNLKLDDDDLLVGDISIVARGTAAARFRRVIAEEAKKSAEDDPLDDEDGDEYMDDYKVGEVSGFEMVNAEDPSKSLQLKYNFTTENNVDFIGDKIFVNPLVIKYLDENPFKLEQRLYPVEQAAPENNTYIFNLDIPEGYEVEELPKRQNLVLPEKGGKYTYISAVQGNKIQVMVRFSLMKTLYLPNEYPSLKEFFNLIMAKQEEQIVLKKKAE